MSIRKYVHQVRPIQEGFLEPAIKIQKFLSEAALKKSELFKTIFLLQDFSATSH